ncbi:hypothetical protein OC835_000295 [Tilletia horrida]|nr:hypothetical protein OC835_000295 [Tilletia horrida]
MTSHRPIVRRQSSQALLTHQDRLRSGPRISPPLNITILTSPTGDLAPPVYAESFSPVSPTSYGRFGLTLGPEAKEKSHGTPTSLFPTSMYAHLSARRGSGASTSSISSHGSSPVESSRASSYLSLASLDHTAGGPRTPSYLGLSPRSSTRDLPEDTIVDHLPSSEIACRAVTLIARRTSSSTHDPSSQDSYDFPETAKQVKRNHSSDKEPPSPRTRLSAAALAELELETKCSQGHSDSAATAESNVPQPYAHHNIPSHLRAKLRPKSSGGDSATSCGTVKPGKRFAKGKTAALRPFAMTKQHSRLSRAQDSGDDTDADLCSEAGTETPAISPSGARVQLRNPFELMRQQDASPAGQARMPPAPRLQPQQPFDDDDDDDGSEQDGSSSGSSSDESEDDAREASASPQRRALVRRSMPSPLALPEGLTNLNLDLSSWRHGEVESAWREAAKRREERFRKRATVCGVVQIEVDEEDLSSDDCTETGLGEDVATTERKGSVPATPGSVMREATQASARMLDGSAHARTTPRPESWSPARFADAGLTSRQVQVFSSTACQDVVEAGSAATGERMTAAMREENVVPVLPSPAHSLPRAPARPIKNKLRAISTLRNPVPLDLSKLQDDGPIPPGLRNSIDRARRASNASSSSASAHRPEAGRIFFLAGNSPASPVSPSTTTTTTTTTAAAGPGGRRISVSMPLFLPLPGPALLGNGAGGALLSPAIATAAISAAVAASSEEHDMLIPEHGSGALSASPARLLRTTAQQSPSSSASGPGRRRSSYAALRRPPSPPLGTSPVEEPALNSLFAALASAANMGAASGNTSGMSPRGAHLPFHAQGGAGDARKHSLVQAAVSAAAAAAASASSASGSGSSRRSVSLSKSRAPSLADVQLNNHARHGFIVDATAPAPAPAPGA